MNQFVVIKVVKLFVGKKNPVAKATGFSKDYFLVVVAFFAVSFVAFFAAFLTIWKLLFFCFGQFFLPLI